MAEVDPATQDVAKTRKGLLFGLLGLVVVAAAIAGVLYVTGIDPFALLDPAPAPAEEPVVTESAGEETTVTPVASPATVPLPPAEAQEAMYWEQVASEETIAELVDNEFAAFELSQIATNNEKADIRVKSTYRDASMMSGWLLLRQYEGAWYFAMITADGHETVTPDLGEPDAAVVKAIVEQQAANQDVYKALLDGTYDTITVTRVTQGSGTAMADIVLSKGTTAGDKGQIGFISKDVNGAAQWFITSFSM